MGKAITTKKLTLKTERFCQVYARDEDCFGNGTQAYLKVFSTKKHPITYNSARQLAYVLLTNPDIVARVRELIDIYISDEVVDKELGTVILQQGDLSSKVSAIREYNRVKDRVSIKIKITDDNEDLSDEEIEKQIANEQKNIIKPAKKL